MSRLAVSKVLPLLAKAKPVVNACSVDVLLGFRISEFRVTSKGEVVRSLLVVQDIRIRRGHHWVSFSVRLSYCVFSAIS